MLHSILLSYQHTEGAPYFRGHSRRSWQPDPNLVGVNDRFEVETSITLKKKKKKQRKKKKERIRKKRVRSFQETDVIFSFFFFHKEDCYYSHHFDYSAAIVRYLCVSMPATGR